MSGHKPVQYPFHCDGCGFRWEDFAYMDGPKESACPECGAAGRRLFAVFASPLSFGHHMFPNRTPLARRKPRKESEERRVWQAQKDAGVSLHQKG